MRDLYDVKIQPDGLLVSVPEGLSNHAKIMTANHNIFFGLSSLKILIPITFSSFGTEQNELYKQRIFK